MSTILFYLGVAAASYIGLMLVLFMLSLRIPAAGFLARLLAAYISLVVCSLYGVFASIVLRVLGYGGISQWAAGRSFKYVMRFTTGVQFTIEDPHNYLGKTRPAVFIGNHQTELDVLMLGTMFPKYCSVTAKASLKNTPVLGWFMRLSKSVFIDRANSSNARNVMAGAAEEIRSQRQSVYMFPEGTRSYSKEPMLLPFKKGAFHLAVQAKVPIVPVVVANYSDVLYVKAWNFKSGSIPIKVLKPIETENLTSADVENLTRDTRELMLKELVSLSARTRGQPIAMPSNTPVVGVVRASGSEATVS